MDPWDCRRNHPTPHVWLKESPEMNGNKAVFHFDNCNLAQRAGEVLSERMATNRSSRWDITAFELPKGECEPFDENPEASAFRETREESCISRVDVIEETIHNVSDNWFAAEISEASQYARVSSWFTGVGNSETVSASFLPCDSEQFSKRKIVKKLKEHLKYHPSKPAATYKPPHNGYNRHRGGGGSSGGFGGGGGERGRTKTDNYRPPQNKPPGTKLCPPNQSESR